VPLTLCSDLSPADWITTSDLPWEQLVTFGPAGFAAYARLRILPDPQFDGQRENDVRLAEDATPESEQLAAVLQVLREHTGTPDDCYFCLWDGWGWGDPVQEPTDVEGMPPVYGGDGWRYVDLATHRAARPGQAPAPPPGPLRPKVVVPGRAYFLFHGTVSELGDWAPDESWPPLPHHDLPPAFVWPADHAWCVTNDVDPHWIGIGADAAAIDRLVAHPLLDVVPGDPGAEQPSYR